MTSLPKPLPPAPSAPTRIRPRCECGEAYRKHVGPAPKRASCGAYRPALRKLVGKLPLVREGETIQQTLARNRKRIRRKSLRPLPKLRDDVWDLFAAYVKERDGNVCFSCGKGGLEKQSWHAGHMFPSGNNAVLRYEPKNVHSQCGRCNCFLSGNGAAYVAHFLEVYGLAELQRIDAKRGQEKKWSRAELMEMGEALKRGGADFECFYAERYGL